MIREVKEDFLCWLTGQVLPERPTTDDYDALARRWSIEVVSTRRHRTTDRVVSEAWAQERKLLRPIPARILHATTAASPQVASECPDPSHFVSMALRASQRPCSPPIARGGVRDASLIVEERVLADYEAKAR